MQANARNRPDGNASEDKRPSNRSIRSIEEGDEIEVVYQNTNGIWTIEATITSAGETALAIETPTQSPNFYGVNRLR